MKGRDLFPALKKAMCSEGEEAPDSDLAKQIGYTKANISGMTRKRLTPTITANLVKRSLNAKKKSIAQSWIKTISEFYPVNVTPSRGGTRQEIFNKADPKKKPLYEALRNAKSGIYSFYNSEGSIIYLGKTKNELWYEMNGAFNRSMEAHEVWTVAHPKNRAFKQTLRRIQRKNVHLHDTAAFFSAYAVDSDFVDGLETLFIRTLPNNLTNVRIEGQTDRTVERPNPRKRKTTKIGRKKRRR
jgi:hypothetical protein